MKLAEALMLRTDLQNKLASLRERVANNAVVQAGDKPHEKPDELMKAAAGLINDRSQLVARINATNQASTLTDGRGLSDLLSRREALAARHALIRTAIDASHKEPDRYSMSEIKWKAVLDIKGLQKQADDLSGQLRAVNAAIQQANWQIDLIDP